RSSVPIIAGAGSVPSPLAGEGRPESQQQDSVRGAARPLIQACQFGRRCCLLPQGEKKIDRSSVPIIAGAGSVPSPLAGEGRPESQQQDWMRGAARPLIQTCQFGRRCCLLPQGEKARS